MKFYKRLLISITIINSLFLMTLILGGMVSFAYGVEGQEIDELQIKSIINEYFDLKYECLHTLEQQDFTHIISEIPKAQRFLEAEIDKRDIEINNAIINNLRYLEYEYFLEYNSLKINKEMETAVVKLILGHDVVFEITPNITSTMRNLNHVIILKKTEKGWKIIKVDYKDDLQRFLDKIGLDKDQIIEHIRLKKQEDEVDLLLDDKDLSPSLKSGTIHEYNRKNAVDYAHKWATDHNSNYGNFSNYGGDCTNFVSQVIHAGDAPMDTTGSYLWYYHDYNDRAPSWTDVDKLYDYLINNNWTGPYASEKSSKQYVKLGDIIQLDFEGDGDWDHSVVVVAILKLSDKLKMILVAKHSTGGSSDQDYLPLVNYRYSIGSRYIHINGYYD
ncbi:hypothetical protein GMMP1_130029 [Candidatus Magnetomoraceae bacterium gMMP-1]